MPLILWIAVFIVSLTVLIKAADIFTDNSERLGIVMGIPAFIVGLTIVSIGTSLPELAAAFVSVFNGSSEIAIANVVGSNVANILLVIGFSAVVAKVLKVKRDLINLDLPLLFGSALILIFVALDGKIVFIESVVLIVGYIIYLFYSLSHKKETEEVVRPREVVREIVQESRRERFIKSAVDIVGDIVGTKKGRDLHIWQNIFLIIISGFFIYLGAKYVIDSLTGIATMAGIGSSVIAMSVLAVGTSLPELVVSISAVLKKKHEMGIGNIIGSNIFNSFVVVGLPGLFTTINVDSNTLLIGMPFMMGATVLFIFSGISKTIYNWEGLFYLLIFFLFISKLFGLF